MQFNSMFCPFQDRLYNGLSHHQGLEKVPEVAAEAATNGDILDDERF